MLDFIVLPNNPFTLRTNSCMDVRNAIGMHAVRVRRTSHYSKSITATDLLASFVYKAVDMPFYFLLGLVLRGMFHHPVELACTFHL